MPTEPNDLLDKMIAPPEHPDPARTVTVTHAYQATPRQIYEAWLNPNIARKWLFAVPTGEMVQAEIDATVGGKFLFVDRRDGQDIAHAGRYVELDPDRRIVFDFGVPQFSQELTRVAVDISPSGAGSSVKLSHENVLPDFLDRTRAGWTMLLDRLAAIVDAA